ncbi:hypothetical protein NPIL_188561 [Nephila pilipes]|uniref:Uncharacterized protein n=1 Tax=Nephila pilipes TaxID=299642 RepID=A0A8X6PTM7_NEPPI|nr:hypothetical protein NPIL_188561 [Nephila pilipes]
MVFLKSRREALKRGEEEFNIGESLCLKRQLGGRKSSPHTPLLDSWRGLAESGTIRWSPLLLCGSLSTAYFYGLVRHQTYP